MKLSLSSRGFLGIEKGEYKVLQHINETPKLTSEICDLISNTIPRSTVVRILSRLHKRGFVDKQKVGRRRGGWISADLKNIEDDLGVDLFGRKEIHISHSDQEVIVYRGKEELLILADKAYKFSKGEIIYWILPPTTKELWKKKLLQRRMREVFSFFKNSQVVVHLVTTQEVFDEMTAAGLDLKTFSVSLVSSSTLIAYSDIMLFRDSVSIMNWRDELAVEIKNGDLVKMFKGIISFMRAHGVMVRV